MATNATNETETQQYSEAASIHDEVIGHGNSPAAWTAVFVMMFGAAVASVGFILASHLVFWAGVAVMPVGLVIGLIMKKAGYGVGGDKLNNSGH